MNSKDQINIVGGLIFSVCISLLSADLIIGQSYGGWEQFIFAVLIFVFSVVGASLLYYLKYVKEKRIFNVCPEFKIRFWKVVIGCILEFHKKPTNLDFARFYATAMQAIAEMRYQVENLSLREKYIFYHNEPFQIACRIFDTSIFLDDGIVERYMRIRKLNNFKVK